jgi:hypothetical protein
MKRFSFLAPLLRYHLLILLCLALAFFLWIFITGLNALNEKTIETITAPQQERVNDVLYQNIADRQVERIQSPIVPFSVNPFE